jgi:hypothetical protein
VGIHPKDGLYSHIYSGSSAPATGPKGGGIP